MVDSALVHKYADDSTGWVLGYGATTNLEVNDPATQAIVPLNEGQRPSASKPYWKQRVDSGVFGDATSEDKDNAKIWLASRFQAHKTLLFQQITPLVITDATVFPVVVGTWISDSRAGTDDEREDSRVFGAIFRWENPVALRPPVFVCKGFNPSGVEQHSKDMHGEPLKKQNDSNVSYEFWKIVTSGNAPTTFRHWQLLLDVPSLQGGESCKLESLRLSSGRRGAL